MKFIADVFVFLTIVIHLATADMQSACMAVVVNARVDCGVTGITADQCRAKGCCYDDTRTGKWCFVAPADGNDCADVTCQNGGTCVDGVYSFTCQCPSGFSGTHCEIAETGSNYIRWGRTTCGATSSVIYKGQAAGSAFGTGGGGANYQCMPHTPQWLNYTPLGGHNSFIYGVQYQLHPGGVFSMSNNGGNDISPNPVACVACFTPGRSSQLMIPAQTQCPAEWTLEYRGYLAAEYVGTGRYPSTYICVDEAPEVANGEPNQAQFQNKGLIYPVRVQCGALLCSDYVSNREVACVVCTR